MKLFKKKKKNPLTPEQLEVLDKSVFETFKSLYFKGMGKIEENWYFWDYEKLKEDNYNGDIQ